MDCSDEESLNSNGSSYKISSENSWCLPESAWMSPPVREQLFAIICFSASSSSLLLINKLCMAHVRAPSLLATLQFGMCTAFALGLKWSGAVNVDDWEWTKLKPYLLYTAMFVASIYCNMQSLAHANVETLIVFRAWCPLLGALLAPAGGDKAAGEKAVAGKRARRHWRCCSTRPRGSRACSRVPRAWPVREEPATLAQAPGPGPRVPRTQSDTNYKF